jgi:hypothetical protein
MLTYKEMKALSAQAQDEFPLTEEMQFILSATGNRECTAELVETRILWMLNQAYNKGKHDAGTQ